MSSNSAPIQLDHIRKERPFSTDLCWSQPHKVPLIDLCLHLDLFDTHAGLTTTQVNDAQAKYGLNQPAPVAQPSYLRLFFLQAFTGFNALLWIAALFAFLAYQPFGSPEPDPTK